MAKSTKKPAVPAPPAVNGAASEVLTLAKAAAYLRLNEATVLDLIQTQALPGRAVGNEWRF